MLLKGQMRPDQDGQIRQTLSCSEDEGRTWTTLFDGLFSPDDSVWIGRGRR